MEPRGVRGGAVTRWGRLVVLLAFAAGFSTMHGFLAVSASADTHLGHQHGVVLTQVPDAPTPAEHHDLVAGCVVALVGVGLVGVALLLRRRCAAIEGHRTRAPVTIGSIGLSAAQWSPPRVALCVIRV